jgi:hypothetical protein
MKLELTKMTDKEKIAQLESTLKDVLEAYNILEEYACELVDDAEDNETITHANSIVQIAINSTYAV